MTLSTRVRGPAAAAALAVLSFAAAAALVAPALPAVAQTPAPAEGSGVLRVRSPLGVDATIARIRAAVEAKGIRWFDDIDQSALAAGANIKLAPSHLLVFGNPPLGIKFLTSNPYAGLDWPVRMLVTQDDQGQVWVAWTDFDWIARRHHIEDRGADFKMASEVAASIAASPSAP